ncbi:phosphotransferase [Streptomyces sp. NPDC093589]|uniref:phosphotransferase n=1 Tax=Streptomyces sp. NPDC093589 TaxID=3366043 RepID=UPI00381E7D97
MSDGEALTQAVADTLVLAYHLAPAEMEQVVAGTATTNFRITDREGRRWFAKIYRDDVALDCERSAVELAQFARTARVPIPAVRRTIAGELVMSGGRLPMSLWEYVEGAETAEGGLVGARWASVGTVLGHLARRPGVPEPAAARRQRGGGHRLPAAAPTVRGMGDRTDRSGPADGAARR